ncbi:MAG: glycosyltransferase [Myxococcales bacterium]|nr:glycosyltransferase [Myxococcales bacterium]
MSTVLVYTSPARGHLYPLLPTLLELKARGHRVHVRTLSGEVAGLLRLGIEASPILPSIEGTELDDWKAKSPLQAVGRTFTTWLERAAHEVADLRAAIAACAPDVLYVDVNAWGALAAAEASGLPFAVFSPYFLNVRAKGRPPFGLGLMPTTGVFGRIRDAVVRAVAGIATRPYLRRLNALRRGLGLPSLASFEQLTSPADRVIAYTAEPFEYGHGGWPDNVRFVGPGIWEPPAADELPGTRALVLVTCSTEFQDDGALIATALAALEAEDVDVVATTAALDPIQFRAPANATVLRYAAHGPLLRRAVAVICHGGMGITQKALAAGVPVCVVPFGRDQFDVGRHVEHAGAGVTLTRARLSAQALRDAVHRTRSLRAGAERVARAFAASGGAASAADVIDELFTPRMRTSTA